MEGLICRMLRCANEGEGEDGKGESAEALTTGRRRFDTTPVEALPSGVQVFPAKSSNPIASPVTSICPRSALGCAAVPPRHGANVPSTPPRRPATMSYLLGHDSLLGGSGAATSVLPKPTQRLPLTSRRLSGVRRTSLGPAPSIVKPVSLVSADAIDKENLAAGARGKRRATINSGPAPLFSASSSSAMTAPIPGRTLCLCRFVR